MTDAIVIGAGPAGLMAAEMLADQRISVTVIEAKPSVGRKLLMAGKSGLNLTKAEPFDDFLSRYDEAAAWLTPILRGFSNTDVADWARALGQEVFTGSTGRVFPTAMKASPLLRAWLKRLDGKGVKFNTRWRWTGWQGESPVFSTPGGTRLLTPKTTVLALGGASWPRLGSDGTWAEILRDHGIMLAPFQAANAGLVVPWSDHMRKHFGKPVKACTLVAGGLHSRGEFVITKSGLEGGGIYAISKSVRSGAGLSLDLLPDLTQAEITRRLNRPQGKTSLTNHLRKALRLDPQRLALIQEFARPLPTEPAALARLIKCLPVRHRGLQPIERAISVAGGIKQAALTSKLMLTGMPGIFCAGEMLDWEAPTGGYLLTACLATGKHAGLAAAKYADHRPPTPKPATKDHNGRSVG